MNCIFCKIINNELPSEKLFEDDKLIVFKDIRPSAPIDYLVVPKEHIESIAHLEDSNRDIVANMIFVAKDLAKKLELIGYKILFNVGREGGQEIDHLHLHLLGGWDASEKSEHLPS